MRLPAIPFAPRHGQDAGRVADPRKPSWHPEGGGEYNVARGLRRCFGLRASVVTALADNDIGCLAEDLILQGGVDTSFVRWVPYDGVGRTVRNGLNFTERGFGARGARWFHTGGIYASLSPAAAQVVAEAARAARRQGAIVSYDLNYRPSLWQAIGGQARAQEVNRALVRHVDVLLGNEEDFTACLGYEVPDTGEYFGSLSAANFKQMIAKVTADLPHLSAVATTLRAVRSATVNDWGAVVWAGGEFAEATHRPGLEIFDRVGGGDSFASGLIYGLMTFDDLTMAVEYGAAHGALAMTTPGDTSMASLAEVAALAGGGSARVQR